MINTIICVYGKPIKHNIEQVNMGMGWESGVPHLLFNVIAKNNTPWTRDTYYHLSWECPRHFPNLSQVCHIP